MAILWDALDDYFATELLAEMGADGDYLTLQLQDVTINDDWKVEDAIRNNVFPLGIVRTLAVEEDAGEHGSFGDTGKTRVVNQYGYVIITVTVAEDRDICRQQIRTMRSRVLSFLRARPSCGGLIGDDGERVRRILFDTTIPRMFNAGNVSAFYGITETYFAVETKG